MKKLLTLLFIGISLISFSQTPWYEMTINQGFTFTEIENAFEQQLKGLTQEEREAQYKHFNRWKRDVIGFVKPNGNFQSPDERQAEHMQHLASYKKANSGKWKEIGPFVANDVYRGIGRINCIAFHPTDSNIMYCGAPYGGVWKTTDYGNTWENLTDHLPSFGVSTIVIDPSNSDIIYVGTGDVNTGRNPGTGVWKSLDGGKNWTQKNLLMGNAIVGDLLIFKDKTSDLIAATSKGIYTSKDGGDSWQRSVGGNYKELRFCPQNNDIVYAVTNSSFSVSDDRGQTFSTKNTAKPLGSRMSLAVSEAEPSAVYLVGEDYIVKSDSFGENIYILHTENNQRDLGKQSWYNNTAEASNTKPVVLYQGHTPTYKTNNGAVSFVKLSNVHSDVHYMRHSPITGRLWLTGDGGVVALDRDGITFSDFTNMGVAEIYSMSQHPNEIDHILNGYQDCGTKYYVGNEWLSRVGADGMDCVFDPDSPEIYFTTIQYGDIRRHIGGPYGKVSNFPDPQGSSEAERGPWESPVVLDKSDPTILYTAQNSVYRYKNARENKPKKNRWENIGNGLPNVGAYWELEQNDAAPSTWYVSNGAFVYRTKSIHAEKPQWESLANNYPRTAKVLDIECAGTDSNLLFFSMNQRVFKSENGGETFSEISEGLPQLPFYSLQFDAVTGHLYAGGEAGVFVLLNGDSTWNEFSDGLSLSAPVYELEIFYHSQDHNNSMLKAATYGRGMWESPLYGSQPDPMLPFYAIISTNNSLLEQEEFMVDVEFRRGAAFIDVLDFDASDFDLRNCEVLDIKGKNGLYLVTMKALEQGEVSIHIAEEKVENASLKGQFNLESQVLEFNYIKEGTHFGFEGPGGVGSINQIAIWLDGEQIAKNHQTGDEIKSWQDWYRVGISANQEDSLNGPILWQNDTVFNGLHALAFDSARLSELTIKGMMTSTNISAITVANSDFDPFKENAWMGSSRMENGYIIHPWKNRRYCHVYAYDSSNQNVHSQSIEVKDVRDPHIFGMAYRNDIYIWNYTDDTAAFELIKTPRPRKDSVAIDVKLGADRDDRWGDGKIACHLVFNEALMLTHRTLVYNYLASRFGISIVDIDRYSYEATHSVDMAGIGRETDIDFHDNAQGTGLLRISSPKEMDAGEYLLWASNGNAIADWKQYEGLTGFEKSAIEWRFDETGELGLVAAHISANQFETGYNYYLSWKDAEEKLQLQTLTTDKVDYYAQFNPSKGQILMILRSAMTSENAPELFPNPVSSAGNFTVKYLSKSPEDQNVVLFLYDVRGRLVSEQPFILSPGQPLHYFQISQLQQAIYILKTELDGVEYEFKLRVE